MQDSSIGWGTSEWGSAMSYSAPQMTGDSLTAEEWLHVIINLLADIVNFRGQQFSSWEHLAWWQKSIPQELQPLVKSSPSTTSTSNFPRYWQVFLLLLEVYYLKVIAFPHAVQQSQTFSIIWRFVC